MKKEKGFTLIELLAVIVILAILMVIAVPKILNVIENSRKSAAESSIKLVKDAIRSQVTSESMMGTNFTSDESGCYTFNFDDQENGNAKELQLKNKENITGAIKYCNGNFTNNTLSFDGQDMSSIVCKRAIKLHTEKCAQTHNTYYCSGAGLTGKTITYGSLGTKGTLKSGDAFDCDVNGNGEYNPDTERFYYVTDMDDSTAVLIYYNNVRNGKPSNSATYAYDSSNENWHGPRTAIEQLPSTSEWRNVSLKNSTRAILNENGGNTTEGETLPSDFSYAGKSARLLTIQEVEKEKEKIDPESSNYDSFNYLFENTKYSNSKIGNGYWLENAQSDFSVILYADSYFRSFSGQNSAGGGMGVRPVIEVSKSNIEY